MFPVKESRTLYHVVHCFSTVACPPALCIKSPERDFRFLLTLCRSRSTWNGGMDYEIIIFTNVNCIEKHVYFPVSSLKRMSQLSTAFEMNVFNLYPRNNHLKVNSICHASAYADMVKNSISIHTIFSWIPLI